MNLDDFQLNDAPLEMTVTHPVTGEMTDATIRLLSPYAAEYRMRKNALARETLQQAIQETKHDTELELRLTAAVIAGWSGLMLQGAVLEYSASEAEKLLQLYPWLREQIVFFYNDASRFFKGFSGD